MQFFLLNRKHVNEFLNLRGCTWAYSNEDSLSSSTVVLRKLKEAGEKATFFGNKLSKIFLETHQNLIYEGIFTFNSKIANY
jgi:hypothetical protein